MKRLFIALCLITCMGTASMSWASYSRGYIPFSPDTSLLCLYYNHVTANTVYKHGSKVGSTDDYNKRLNVGMLRFIHYLGVGNSLYGDGKFIIDPQFIVPFVDINLSGNYEALNGGKEFSNSGIGDPVLLATFWFVNDPKHKFWIGFTPWLTVPLGQYDKKKIANPGGNRWAIKPELGVVKGVGDKAYLELALGGEFYSANDAYRINKKLEQDPTLQVEAHLSYDVTKQLGVALDYYNSFGGETRINGVKQNNKLGNHALGCSLFFMIGSNNQLLVSYRDDFAVKTGTGDSTIGIRWSYLF